MALTQVDQGLLGSNAQYTGFKNRLINSAMVIDQRNAGASITPTSGQYSVDRWNVYISQNSKFTLQQSSTAPTGFINSLLATSSSAYSVGAGDYFTINQAIEGLNISDLAWGTANAATITLSFWVRSSLTGTFGGALQNNGSSRSYPFSFTINSANTFEQKTITIAGDQSGTWATNTGTGILVRFSLGAGSTSSGTVNTWASANYVQPTGATSVVGTSGATFYITGVQLEKGSTATSFDYRPYGTELALCQRYFLRVLEPNIDFQMVGTRDSTTNAWINIATPVSMRANPTLGVPSGNGRIILYDTGYTLAIPSISSMGITSAGANQYNIYFGIGSTAGSYVYTSYDTVGATTPLTLSAEL